MTDVMSEAFGRDLVSRTTFEKEVLWLPLLAVHHLNAGQPVIDGKTFTDCIIEGPGLIATLGGTMLEDCNLGAVEDPRSLLFKPLGPRLVGVVGFSNTRFVRCRFVQVGFSGTDEFLNEIEIGLSAARAPMQ